ncbi:site-specific DNA-methyltransferase [Streptomycetaceae bacterium NBC_01309]
MPDWTLHHGDALTTLPTLAADSVDCVVTDPPYNSGGRTTGERINASARDKYVSGDAQHALTDFVGDNRDQRSYTAWLAMVLAECLRIARPGSSALVFTDWRQLPATTDALQAGGWTWRGIVPWRKPNTRPQRDGFRRACEYVVWGSRGPLAAHPEPVYLPGIVEGSQPRGTARRHITQKPEQVMRELVKVCVPGGVVLDPFTGSGSTGAAALAEGRSFVGIELSAHYADVSRDRFGLGA